MNKLTLVIGLTLIFMSLHSQRYDSFIDSRDKQVYKTVIIGNHCWMAENLNYKTNSGSWCYANSNENCQKLGRLYNWETSKNVCPSGWHLPSKKEWETLLNVFSGEGKLAYEKLIKGGISGFNAILAGDGYNNNFQNINVAGSFWSSTEIGRSSAWYCIFMDRYVNMANPNSKLYGFSVRCVKE